MFSKLSTTLDTEKIDECAICKGDGRPDPWFKQKLALRSPFDVRLCPLCNLRWLSPRPTQQAYKKLYTNHLYFGGQASPESFSELSNIRRPYFRKRLEKCRRFFPEEKKLRILDIGAATGEFTYEALNMGFDAVGIEFSNEALTTAKKKYGIDLIQGSFENITRFPKFDIIHLNHVLEHLPNPAEAVCLCSSCLKADGILIIEVPQQFLNNLDRLKSLLRMSKKKFDIYSLHHTYFFSVGSLTEILKRNGLEILSSRTSNPNYTPLLPLSLKKLTLGSLLFLSDVIHNGGNIIEIYSRKSRI